MFQTTIKGLINNDCFCRLYKTLIPNLGLIIFIRKDAILLTCKFKKSSWLALDPVYTSTDPNGSVPKLAQIGLPFTLDLLFRTHSGVLSGPIWNRFPRCTHLVLCSLRSSVNGWNRSQMGTDWSQCEFRFVFLLDSGQSAENGLDLAVDPFQCKRDLEWICSSVNASKYGHGSKLDPYPFGSILVWTGSYFDSRWFRRHGIQNRSTVAAIL